MATEHITEKDRGRIRALNKELQEIMTKYIRDPTQGPYDPAGQAKWRVNDGIRHFFDTVDPR